MDYKRHYDNHGHGDSGHSTGPSGGYNDRPHGDRGGYGGDRGGGDRGRGGYGGGRGGYGGDRGGDRGAPAFNRQRTDPGPVTLRANSFHFTPSRGPVYSHEVTFTPDQCGQRQKAYVLRQNALIGAKDFVLSERILLFREQMPASEWAVTTKQGMEIKVAMREGVAVDFNAPSGLLQARAINNLVLRRSMGLLEGFSLIGRNYVNLNDQVSAIPRLGLTQFQGVEMSSYLGAIGPLVSLDLFSRSMGSVSIAEMLNNRSLTAQELVQANVITMYNNTMYRVARVDYSKHPTDTFPTKNGDVRFMDYALQRYDQKLRIDPTTQPMLVAIWRGKRLADGRREEREVHLIPELCRLVGMTKRQKGSLDMRRDVVRTSVRERREKMERFVQRFNQVIPAVCQMGHTMQLAPPTGHHQESMKCATCSASAAMFTCKKCKTGQCRACVEARLDKQGFKVALQEQLIEFQGRQMANENLHYHAQNGSGLNFPVFSGNWDQMAKECAYPPTKINQWFVVHGDRFSPSRLFETLQRMGKGGGMFKGMNVDFQWPGQFEFKMRGSDMQSWIRDLTGMLRTLPGIPQIGLVIVPSNSKDDYDKLKQFFQDMNIVTQFVTEGKASEAKPAVVGKILMQMMTKMNVFPWTADFADLHIPQGETMFVGIDVVGEGRGFGNRQYLVTMVSSNSKDFTRYYSQAEHCAEGVTCIGKFFKSALDSWAVNNSPDPTQPHYPKGCIIYRNGVSDAEIKRIEQEELPAIRKLAEDHGTAMDFILVLRKGSTRVFNFQGILQPGTVIDTVITTNVQDTELFKRGDFFLISQPCIPERNPPASTLRPTHYRVIEQHTPLTLQDLELLTYKLTHLYFNWSGTIACPAPVLLAQKLTRIISEHSIPVPSDVMKQRLFYL